MQNDIPTQRLTAPFYWFIWTGIDWITLLISFYILFKSVTYTLMVQNVYTYCLSFIVFITVWIVFGARQHALAIMAHDGAHGLIFQNLFLNDMVTKICTLLPFGVSLRRFRKFHFSHHKYRGTDKDPEIQLKKMTNGLYNLPNKGIATVFRQGVESLFGFSLKEVSTVIRHSGAPQSLTEYCDLILFWLALLFFIFYTKNIFLLSFIFFWFFCLCTSFFLFFKLRIFTEHVGTLSTHRIKKNTYTSFFICPHNTWCHYEHHELPYISSQKLPEFRGRLSPDITELSLLDLYHSYKHASPHRLD